MTHLYVDDEMIKGNVKDIKRYMIKELSNYLDAEDENLNTWVDMIYNVNDILQTIADLSDGEHVTLKYNPMGAWYIESEEK